MEKSEYRGLSVQEAAARLIADGPNELPKPDRRTAFRIILEVLREPMLALLLAGGVIYLFLGSIEEALILLALACFSILITVIQESRTERVLEALRDLSSPRALVLREGQRTRIPGREVVRGDVMLVGEGDRVAADARLLESHEMQADEALLTGESVPVRKVAATMPEVAHPGGDDVPIIFAGSLIVRGHGQAEVIATGIQSEMGKIGQALREVDVTPPRLQMQTRRLVRIFAAIGISVSVALVVLYGVLRGNWLEGALAGIALGMSMLPEEFPVVLTVFMAMGAWRISKARVLTRRAAAIETLGSATVLCTDKTGTLTENRMQLAQLVLPTGKTQTATSMAVPKIFLPLLKAGALASVPQAVDPMDRAFLEASPGAAESLQLLKTYGLKPNLLAVTQVWRQSANSPLIVAAKGAPEAIAQLCNLSKNQSAKLDKILNQLATQGLRVLAVATAKPTSKKLPTSPTTFDFKFEGLVGLADPIRKSVPDAMRQCREAGIRVVMITGDFPATAQAIAKQAGINAEFVIAGPDIAKMTDDELRLAVRSTNVFARIMPQQKLRIVEALQFNGDVVAMTGDGVNDAPSLKAAHIGIAMGGRGTDVAREASSIVLLDDDFSSIVKAVSLGRRIYDNLRKAMGFILAVHVPIAGLAVAPLVFGWPVLFSPIHIAFLEMVIDPVCSLAFEAEGEERDAMKRPPRDPAEPLFTNSMVIRSLLQGVATLAVVSAVYAYASGQAYADNEVRAITFVTLVLSIIALIFVDRANTASLVEAFTRGNVALTVVLAVVFGTMGLILLWGPAAQMFSFGPLQIDDLLISAAAAAGLLVFLEVMKWLGVSQRPATK